MSNDNVAFEQLKSALGAAYDGGYAKGRVDALKALSMSLHLVYDLGILSEEEKKGYKITLETVDATLKILEQSNEESDF